MSTSTKLSIPFQQTEMEIKITPITRDEIPESVQVERRSQWDGIIDGFLAQNVEVARLDCNWPEGTTNGQAETVYGGLRNRLQKRRLEIECMRRNGDIFLVKRRPEEYRYTTKKL